MHYFLLACDYDGTLATEGHVGEATLAALERCRQSGRRAVLVTGRILDDLAKHCDCFDLFEWIVAENGAILYQPSTRKEKLLTKGPSQELVETLQRKGIGLGVGRAIIGTHESHKSLVLKAIQELGLELQLIFNRGSLMVLPSGINKASGLQAILEEMQVSPHNVIAIGDAENDHSLLDACETGVAVANAVAMLRWKADLVTSGENGAGVRELIDQILANDLAELQPRLTGREGATKKLK
jgi:hypothetical protein